MRRPKQPTALVFCVADHPVLSALLTVCRDIAASGRGLRSADDYRRWWFVVTAQAHTDQLALPPDDPGLQDEEFIPGFSEGVIQLLLPLERIDDLLPVVGNKRPYYVCSHARLTEEPLQDYLRERGFEILRPRDLLDRERNRWWPSGGNDRFDYEERIADALAHGERTVSADDRIALAYVLGELDELPAALTPSDFFFESVPELPHPSEWCAHDHRQFDVLCAARAFERIPSRGYDVAWAGALHAWARELGRRGVPQVHALHAVIECRRSLAEDLELVAASGDLRDAWGGDPSVLERQLDRVKRSLVAKIEDGLVFDDVGEAPPDETRACIERPCSPVSRSAFENGDLYFSGGWGRDRILIVVGERHLALRSTDAGETWSLGLLPLEQPDAIAGARLDDGSDLVVVVGDGGVAWSWDRGETWASSHSRSRFRAVAIAPDGRVCAVGRWVYAVSCDPGELLAIEQPIGFEDVTFDGARFLAVAMDGSVLAHEGDGWRQLARLDAAARAIAARDGLLMVLTDEGCATSEDGGQRWTWTTDDRLGRARAAAITRDGRRYLVADRVLTSEDGQRWEIVPVADGQVARSVAVMEDAVLITSWHSIAIVARESSTALCFGAVEFAARPEHYPVTEHGFTMASFPAADDATAFFADGDRLVLATDECLLLSEDRGRSFVPAVAPRGRRVTSIVEYGGELWAACQGVLRSTDGGRSWLTVEAPQITELLVTTDGELFGVRGDRLLRRDPQERSGWRICRRFERDIEVLVSDASGAIYLVADTLHVSDDGGSSWRSSYFEEAIVGLVASADGLIACDRQSLHVSHDQGRSFESHPLPLYIGSRERGQVRSLCAGASGDLYFSTDQLLLHSTDLGRTLAHVRAPFANPRYAIRSVVENAGSQYLLLDTYRLLERVDGRELPEPRFIEVEVR